MRQKGNGYQIETPIWHINATMPHMDHGSWINLSNQAASMVDTGFFPPVNTHGIIISLFRSRGFIWECMMA